VIAEHQKPVRNDRTAARVVDGKALIVILDKRQLHTLNAVGTRVWELCDGRTVGAIADVITAEFAVERARALGDVQRFVAQLQQVGALVLEAA
jgi:hypothetical protein